MKIEFMETLDDVMKQVTPRGDGNSFRTVSSSSSVRVMKQVTPRGDGNRLLYLLSYRQ